MHLCETLYERTSTPAATTAVRCMFITTMCEKVTSDLLCCSMEKALHQGGAQAEHLHACAPQVLAAAAVHSKMG